MEQALKFYVYLRSKLFYCKSVFIVDTLLVYSGSLYRGIPLWEYQVFMTIEGFGFTSGRLDFT